MEFQAPTQEPSPVPSLPAAAGPPPHLPPVDSAHHTLKSRRRTSLPASVTSTEPRPSKRRPNAIRTQAASPQVISSLIDQLSAGTIPSPNHFENLQVGYDIGPSVSPSPSVGTHSTRNSFTLHYGNSIDHTTYFNSTPDENHLYADACESPVIRTSKPPSGLSPLTAAKKRDKPHSLSSYIGRSGGSSASLHSTPSSHSVSSLGNISIEAPAQRHPHSDSNRSSVESKRSAKAHRSLMYMSSRERLKQKETERKRVTVHGLDDLSRFDSIKKPSPQLFPYEDTIKEEPSSAKEEPISPITESPRYSPRFPSSPRRIRLNFLDDAPGENPSDSNFIPDRRSSLKHSGSPPRKSGKGHTDEARRKRNSQPISDIVVEGDEKTQQEAVMKERLLKELEQEENDVAHRIRELKEQKLRRDKIAGKMPATNLDTVSPALGVPRSSPLSSPALSPISPVSSSEIRGQDSNKARKVLGLSIQKSTPVTSSEKLPDKNAGRESKPVVPPQSRSSRQARHRSLTLNDGNELTPLPINYALALKRLAPLSPPLQPPQASSLSPASASPTTPKAKRPSKDAASPKRPSSAAVGDRPAIGRRAATTPANLDQIGDTSGHKHSSSVTDAAATMMSPPVRPNSEEIASRHKSMHVTSPTASNSMLLQRRRTLTKKRWSHPDLPAKEENDQLHKTDRSEAKAGADAVQSPSQLVVEERAASLDSIDTDVESYLESPRLSQKIRHPQSGRIISFSEVGDPQGYAVFVCVGMGLTRYVMAFYDQLATTLKLRLITPDRPGIGGSQVDPNGTPLSWPDDVLVICQTLKISKFSLLAHSAGAVYALATSLRMPQHIRGRVHLLAPWIPPSQMAPIGVSQDSPPTQQLPRSQRFLRALPPSLLKVANSTFLSASSASLQRTGPKNSPKTKRKPTAPQAVQAPRLVLKDQHRQSMMLMDQVLPNASSLTLTSAVDANHEDTKRAQEELTIAERERQHAFDERLTFAIWDRATMNANPATDLIVCLETKQTIGFRYEDINRPVVIHHGSKDSRVPVDNVRWLGRLMRKCEVRILEGEQHGLMASAQVMGNVLTEMASDWDDWTSIVNQKSPPGDFPSISHHKTTEQPRNLMPLAA